MTKKIIHSQDSGRFDNDFLRPRKVMEVFHEINKEGFVNGEIEADKLRYIGGNATYHLLDCSVNYEFNPGLGKFPRMREKITAYADGENEKSKIEELENALTESFSKKGLKMIVPDQNKVRGLFANKDIERRFHELKKKNLK